MTDFEKAMRSALQKLYPQSKLYACWFHFTQAVKGHAQQISGFYNAITSDRLAMEIYGKMLCLPLLPAKHINATWALIRTEAFDFDKNRFKRFVKYYEQQWIIKVCDFLFRFVLSLIYIGNFELQEGANTISVFGRQTRTTNALEAYNGVIGKRMPKKGQFFRFLKVLLQEEYNKCKEFSDLIRTGGETGRKRRYRVCIFFQCIVFLYCICVLIFIVSK